MWTLQYALDLCKRVEEICPRFGYHVALTGGCLYKEGPRKDCDLIFYRIRNPRVLDLPGMLAALGEARLVKLSGEGWCVKADYCGKKVDLLFPEESHGSY